DVGIGLPHRAPDNMNLPVRRERDVAELLFDRRVSDLVACAGGEVVHHQVPASGGGVAGLEGDQAAADVWVALVAVQRNLLLRAAARRPSVDVGRRGASGRPGGLVDDHLAIGIGILVVTFGAGQLRRRPGALRTGSLPDIAAGLKLLALLPDERRAIGADGW